MDVLLTPELERFVSQKMQTGRYATASDLVNEALGILKQQDEFAPNMRNICEPSWAGAFSN